jgi:hypothetical protein
MQNNLIHACYSVIILNIMYTSHAYTIPINFITRRVIVNISHLDIIKYGLKLELNMV